MEHSGAKVRPAGSPELDPSVYALAPPEPHDEALEPEWSAEDPATPDHAPRCPRCGYSLFGLVNIRCPECGHIPSSLELAHSPDYWRRQARCARRAKWTWVLGRIALVLTAVLLLVVAQRYGGYALLMVGAPLVGLFTPPLLYQRYVGGHFDIVLLITAGLSALFIGTLLTVLIALGL